MSGDRDDGWDLPLEPGSADPCEAAAAEEGTAEAHRAGCARCAADAAAGERIAEALRAAAPSRDLSADVLARIREEKSGARPSRPFRAVGIRRWLLPATAAAAVLLVAVGLRPAISARWWPSPGRTPSGGEVATPAAGPASPFAFADATAAAGIDFRHHAPLDRLTAIAESAGSGVAAADFDGDGLPDLFFADAWALGSPRPAGAGCRLYRNRGDGTFADATAAAGIDVPDRVGGVTAADLDGDGRRDLVLACYGGVRILRNVGPGEGGMRFEDVSAAAGLRPEPSSWCTSAAVADFDRDGIPDLFVTRYADQEAYLASRALLGTPTGREGTWRGLPVFAGPQPLVPQGDLLYLGREGLRFEDATDRLEGLEPRYGFQAVATDADGDGWIDVYVANDMQPNSLWRNLGNGRFRDVGVEAGCAYDAAGKAQAGMGVAVGDGNGDGLPEILVTNFSNDHLTLYGNESAPGRPAFADRSYPSGVGPPSFHFLGWGAVFADLDRDGEEDLVTANGHLYPNVADLPGVDVAFAERLQVFRGLGEGRFADVGARTRGAAIPRVHRGLATLDYDGDGRLDLVATTLGGPAVLLRNVTEKGDRRWVGFRLRGTASGAEAAGARVAVTAGGRTRTRELHRGDSYASSGEPVLRFGLGTATEAERVVVRWPSGRTDVLGPLPSDRIHEVVEGR
jgi:hypothetical protein